MTVEELIEQLRQIPGNYGVYQCTDKRCSPVLSVATVHEQPSGMSYVIID